MTADDPVPAGEQPAETTLQPLLLHSLSELREIWRPLLEAAAVRSVTEVGSESGVTSELLIELLHAAGGGELVIVDPGAKEIAAPDDVQRTIVSGFSPEALEGLPSTDAYLLDGDHNYWTVSHELAAIAAAAADREHFPLVLMNDVSWPAARRDQYYAPGRLPRDAVHPHSFDLGAVPGKVGLQRSGFRGEGAFAYALEEGGPRNGVLTAVEDFLAARDELELHLVAPVFGLGVILDRRAPWAAAARELLRPFAGSPFLARLERNRTELYVRVIELQDQFAQLATVHRQAARARRTDQVRWDAAIGEATTRELQLREQLGELERELRATQGQLAAAAGELQQLRQAPPPAGWRQLLRKLRG